MLKLSNTLSLPDEAITQTFGILAKRGVGKTYTASVMVEEMLKNNLPVVVLDPIGVWWGLRSSADGKKPGLSIIIAGGDHADIPITPENGSVMANLVVDERLSVVIDFSHFRKGEQVKFVTDFAETLYHRNRNALHLVVDEADAFAPQRAMPNEARMLGAFEDLVRRGRARGIGVTMITQRPAVLNKNVLTQIEVLIALRMTAPLDQKAIDDWIRTHADEDQRELFMSSLPSLPIGEAWFWSPGWLDIFQRVKIRKRLTLDSSSTPKIGEKAITPRNMADVNLDAIRSKLAETIEKVQSEDPKVLKKQIKDLEFKLNKKIVAEVITQVEVMPTETIRLIEDLKLSAIGVIERADRMLEYVKQFPSTRDTHPHIDPPRLVHKPNSEEVVASMKNDRPAILPVREEGSLSKYALTLLETMAERYPMKLTRSQISTLSGRKPRSSAFSAAMAELGRDGYIEKVGDQFALTDRAWSTIGGERRTPKSSAEIQSQWLGALPVYERDLLERLINHYPAAMTRQELSEATGRSLTSSAFHSAISSLGKNELIESNNGEIRASEVLFS